MPLLAALAFLGLTLLLGTPLAQVVLRTPVRLRVPALGLALLTAAWTAQVAVTLGTLGLSAADVPAFLTDTGTGRAMLTGLLGGTLLLAARVSLTPLLPLGPALAMLPGALLLVWGASGVGHGAGHTLEIRALHALHLTAMSAWVGGVIALTLARPLAARAAARFTPLATGSLAALAVTGLLLGSEHLPTPAEWTGTRYGQTLLVKLILVTLAVGAAALVRRAFARQDRRVRLLLAREAVLLLAVLGVTGVLSTTDPHDHPGPDHSQGQFHLPAARHAHIVQRSASQQNSESVRETLPTSELSGLAELRSRAST
ncbi:copper resistance D family protein [Deinococcus sedimenti]|uniref:Copper resistance protein D domain-containing protein n=1 Tax=Deinococcus sedimenti TaxID=1867090 RepID=A0ABQ2S6W8_9DEIO|nr:CopD family protein [Deinococcus sedimenti]GGR92615.1 hypothetical protein GCM10008960_19430 [Deinococcus sedimenti]